MTTAAPTWQDLFKDQRHAMLGQLARASRHSLVRALSDDETFLAGGAGLSARLSPRPGAEAPARSVMLTPESPQTTLESFQTILQELRQTYPQAEIAGFGPLTEPPSRRFSGLDRGVVLAGRVGTRLEVGPDLDQLEDVSVPLTAALMYAPDVTPEALQEAAETFQRVPHLVSVVPLPAGAGDRIPLPGLTTAGTADAMVVAALRLLLPSRIRVRASWAALGWKVAQVVLAYGADEVAGWTAAESLAYTGRVRAASRVDRKELDEGLREARCRDGGWYERVR